MRPPKRVHLPSGLVVGLQVHERLATSTSSTRARERARGAPLFSELRDLVDAGDLALGGRAGDVALSDLPLRDFHALRALVIRLGWLSEAPIDVACRNCAEAITLAPCAALELGPFVDGELDDAELDRTLDLSRAHPIPLVALEGGEEAREVVLRDVTAGEAAALHRALRRRRLAVSERVVRAMGIDALGPERDPRRIARALARCSNAAWGAIGNLFLEAHYPARLCAVTLCPKCRARNDVDAPYEREFDRWDGDATPGQSNAGSFPDFEVFGEATRAIFEQRAGGHGAPFDTSVRLVVEGGVAACDDGGEPLLGSYVAPGGDPTAPMGAAEISVYYRTFRAVWEEEGPYDWEAELRETIEHELAHHDAWRVGHDPMDDEERAEIARERARLMGRGETVRQSLSAFHDDVLGFVARTWPIWLIVAVASIAMIVCGFREK
jgi:hypothetical protein